MLVYKRLLTIALTWKISRVIKNYNWKTSEIYLFKHVIMLFRRWRCKQTYTWNIVPVMDGGMFHNYVHVCKQLFFVWRNQIPLHLIDTSFVSFSLFYKGVEEKGKKPRIKRKTMAQWMNLLRNSRFVN